MKKHRKVKTEGTPRIEGLESLEARQLLAAVDVGITTAIPLVTNDTTPALVGTVSDNTADVQVAIKQGVTTIGTWDAIEDGAGGWQFTLPDPDALGDGIYDILITASANGGADYGEFSAPAALNVDATPPAAPSLPCLVPGDNTNVSEGTGAGLISANGSILITAKGLSLYMVFIGNVGHDQVSGTDLLAMDAGKAAPRNLAAWGSAAVEDRVDGPQESYGALTLEQNISTATPIQVLDENEDLILTGWNEDGVAKDTYVNVDLAGLSASGHKLWLMYQVSGSDPVFVEILAPQPITNDPTPTFIGTAEANATVELFDGAASLGTTVVNSRGYWGITVPLADDDYSISATVTDTAGNTSEASSALLITVDASAPTATFAGLATNARSPELTGTIDDPGATIVVNVNGTDYAALNNGDGTWTLAAGQIDDLADGVHDVTVTATDAGGLWTSEENPDSLTVEATAPVVTLNSLGTNIVSPALGGSVDDPIATVSVNVNGADYVASNNGDGTWSLAAGQIDDLAEGTYNVTVTATDAFGNAGTDASTDELVIDLTAPVVTVTGLTTNVASPSLTGTVNDPAATIIVSVNGSDYAAVNNGNGTWTLPAGLIASLAEGTYDATVRATDVAGNEGIGDAASIVINLTVPVARATSTITADTSPALSGSVNDPMATVTVTVRGNTHTVINNGDGTWSLPQGTIASLPNGLYKLKVEVTDQAGNTQEDSSSYLLVDNAGPLLTVDKTLTTDTTPALRGTIDDNGAQVVVTVSGVDYDAVNNGDGTWTLGDNTLAALGQGVHTVTVAATDAADNIGTATGVLSIAGTVTVTLGAGISSVTYYDADGTKVALSVGTGRMNVDLTGVNVTMSGIGKTRTVTANGGVMRMAVDVVQNSKSLLVKTSRGGDGLATISAITGDGILGVLSGSNLIIGGDGIDMAGRIQSIKVYGITADVVMNAATLPTKGVAIAARVVRDCTIQTAYIKSLSVVSGIKNANVEAAAIAKIVVKGGFENSNVTADSIGYATLYNVAADNGEVPFGLTTGRLTKLVLKQGRTTLVWGRDFIDGILDLFVTV